MSLSRVRTSFRYLQGWGLNRFPGQPIPGLDKPFGEDVSPHIQSRPPLAQVEAVSSRPVTCSLGEETDTHLATTSFQVVVESGKVSPQPPFLQAKQPPFPQPRPGPAQPAPAQANCVVAHSLLRGRALPVLESGVGIGERKTFC